VLGGRRAWRSAPGLAIALAPDDGAGLLLGAVPRPRGLGRLGADGARVRLRRAGLGRARARCSRSWRVWPASTGCSLRRVSHSASRRTPRACRSALVALADSAGIPGMVLNVPENGGYILYARGTAHPPFIDSRLRGMDMIHEGLDGGPTGPLGLSCSSRRGRSAMRSSLSHAWSRIVSPPTSRNASNGRWSGMTTAVASSCGGATSG
jgi:hypothetical protein